MYETGLIKEVHNLQNTLWQKNYKDIIPLFCNVMAARVLMCGSENCIKMGRRTIETAEISETYLSVCLYTFPKRPYLATYDVRMPGYEVK
jgi:hypothetical protein